MPPKEVCCSKNCCLCEYLPGGGGKLTLVGESQGGEDNFSDTSVGVGSSYIGLAENLEGELAAYEGGGEGLNGEPEFETESSGGSVVLEDFP